MKMKTFGSEWGVPSAHLLIRQSIYNSVYVFIYRTFSDVFTRCFIFLQEFINENVITDFQEDFVVDLDKQNNERSVTLFFIRPELYTGIKNRIVIFHCFYFW